MQRLPSVHLIISTALIAAGCASRTSSHGFTTMPVTHPITQAELQASGATDPYEAVRLLRPSWLRPRVRTGPGQARDGLPLVYVQNMRFGVVRDLADFRMEAVEEIRYVRPLDATTRWGIGHTGGVIEVIWVNQPLRH